MNNTDPNWRNDGRLMAQAKAHAVALQREAIDDFWRGVGRAARRVVHSVAWQCQGLLRLVERTSVDDALANFYVGRRRVDRGSCGTPSVDSDGQCVVCRRPARAQEVDRREKAPHQLEVVRVVK